MSRDNRKRLSPKEAKHLGFDVKPKDGKRNPRYPIKSHKQLEKLNKLRGNIPLTITGKSTLKDADGKLVMEWTKTSVKDEDKLKVLKAVVETLKEDITPTIKVKRPKQFNNDNLCNQYTLTDYHLGMMSWVDETGGNWDMKIAEETLVRFFEVAISQSPKCNKAIFAQIGDFMHWDGLDAVTPANKHILDADTRFTKLVRVTIRVIKRVIKMLLEKYQEVDIIMAEGNHDPASSVWLREMLYDFYIEEPRINIDTNPDPYYCNVWGKVLNCYHHGHKRNINNIDSVFVSKFKKEYGLADFIYGHLGHLHNEKVKETNLMRLEMHRTLAAKDAYASRGGWGSDRDSKVITYHKNYGEVARLTFNIKMLE